MQNRKCIGAAVFGMAVMGLAFGSGACSSAEKPASTAAAQPVNAQTPTVQEIIDAKKREQVATAKAKSEPLNPYLPTAPKMTPYPSPRSLSSSDMKRLTQQSVEENLRNPKHY